MASIMQRRRTDATRELILQALRDGNTRTAAAAYAGIRRETLWKWIEASDTFGNEVQKAEADAELRHVANIVRAGQEGNWTASAWWLERRRYADWGRKDTADLADAVRALARARGLTEEETANAVAEAEAYLKSMREAARAGR